MNKILATLLFIAVLPLPYAYYEFLRVAVCLGVIYLIINGWQALDSPTKSTLIVIAVLFNPFSALYLSKIIWVIIDIVTGVYLMWLKKAT